MLGGEGSTIIGKSCTDTCSMGPRHPVPGNPLLSVTCKSLPSQSGLKDPPESTPQSYRPQGFVGMLARTERQLLKANGFQ